MNDVSNLTKTKRDASVVEINSDNMESALQKWATVKTVLSWVWLIVRLPLFLVMYWLRLPIVLLCNFISTPMLLAWLFSLYAFPEMHVMVRGFGIISFLAFVIGWTYDFVLMWLSPQQMFRTL